MPEGSRTRDRRHRLCLSSSQSRAKNWNDYQHLEIDVMEQIAKVAMAANVKRLIYTGTIDSYYAGRRAGIITEETPLDPKIKRRNLYARAKAYSEEILLRMHRDSALPVVIVRPGIVIGRGGSPLHWGIGMWWHNSLCQTWGDGHNKLPLVLVQDVVKGLIATAFTPGIEGESFNLVGTPLLSAQDYLNEIGRQGIRYPHYATPIWQFYLLDLFKWSVKTVVRHPDRRLPSYRDWESRTQRAFFDCSRAKERLGWAPVSDRDTLIRQGILEPLDDDMMC